MDKINFNPLQNNLQGAAHALVTFHIKIRTSAHFLLRALLSLETIFYP